MSFAIVSESGSRITVKSSHSVGPDNPKFVEEFSDFGDGACGEPAFPQHLVLDFTPDPDVDNEIVQKKICDFWAFINNTPEINNLMVKPETREIPKASTTSKVHLEVVKYQEDNALNMGATACSMLEAIEEKGLITRTFEAKLPQTYCSLSSHQTEENENAQQKEIREHVSIDSKHAATRRPCPVKKPTSLKAKIMCQKLEEWDKKNPKSMEPPGHPPALHHCIIQGQVFDQ